jgi:APA family basic amino acid/polyamine antiporter
MGLGSAVLLVVGSVIGSGIFLKPRDIARFLPDETWILGAWAVLGFVCLCGAFAYGELGGMFPEAGGQYAFLRETYGRFVAFLYGWCLLLVINTGTMAALGVAFAQNLGKVVPLNQMGAIAVAAAMILVLAVTNHVGVRWGAMLQNLSTLAKLLALCAIVVGGVVAGTLGGVDQAVPAASPLPPSLIVGLVGAAVALFWAYEGWHQLAFSAAEMKNPQRDVPRGLMLGIGLLTVTYVAVNAVYLHVVPLEEMRGLAVEADVPQLTLTRIFGGWAGSLGALLICLSVFGAANPNLLSTPRAFMAMAQDGLVPAPLMRIHPRFRTPHVAIWVQAVWAVILVVVLERFEDITAFVVFAALLFYALVVFGVYILRHRRPDADRPYRCFGYPVTPALFIAVVLFVEVRLLMQEEERDNAVRGLAILAAGAVVYATGLGRRRSPS